MTALKAGEAAVRQRFGGAEPLLYQLLTQVASFVVATSAVCTLMVVAGFRVGGSLPSQIQAGTLSATVMLLANLWMQYIFAFRPDRRAFPVRRIAIVEAVAAAAHVVTFVAVARVAASDTPVAAMVVALAASTAAALVAMAGRLRWAYRTRIVHHEPARILVGTPASTLILDAELVSIAAGELLASRLWARRGVLGGFVMVLLMLTAFGSYSTSVLGMNNGDGTSRVSQAFAAVFSRDPHLGTLSLIWAPIPALVDIMFVVLLQPFGDPLLAAPLMGALFGAIAVVLLYAVIAETGAGRLAAFASAVAFLTYQHTYQSAAAGLSEAPFAAFLLLSLFCYMRWLRSGGQAALIFAGVGGAAATMCRYEAVFWVAAQALGVLLIIGGLERFSPVRVRGRRPAGEGPAAAFGSALVYVLPTVFVLGLWMVINADIKGNPVYFLVGPGSTRESPDTVQKSLEQFPLAYGYHPATASVYAAYHSLSGAITLTLARGLLVSPLLLVSTAGLLAYAAIKRDMRMLVICGLAWSIPAFTALSGYTGALPPWWRYWYWMQPMGLVLASVGIARLPVGRLTAVILLVALAAIPNVRAWVDTYHGFAKTDPVYTPKTPNDRLLNAIFTSEDMGPVPGRRAALGEARAVADFTDAHTGPDDLVMLDVVGPGGPIPMFTERPGNWVTTTDRDFELNYLYTAPEKVQYILVPEPKFDIFTRSIVLQTYDGLWEGDLTWAEQVGEIPGPSRWRLFKVLTAQRQAER